MNFKNPRKVSSYYQLQADDTPSDPLFKEKKILKISDFIKCKNTEFVRKYLQLENLSIFNEMFYTLNQNHRYNTRAANNYQLDPQPTQTAHSTEHIPLERKQQKHGMKSKE